jgi:hypothetical protein
LMIVAKVRNQVLGKFNFLLVKVIMWRSVFIEKNRKQRFSTFMVWWCLENQIGIFSKRISTLFSDFSVKGCH